MNAPARLVMPDVSLVRLGDPGESARIERFVGENGGSVFHRPLWLRAIERGTSQQAMGLALERGGRLSAWLPLTLVHSPLFGRALVSSGFGVGGGVLAERRQDGENLCRAAEELALRTNVSSIELRGGDAPGDWEQTSTSHCNFSGDLATSDEAQLLAIPRKARAEVRKGLNGDFSIAVGADEDDRAAHYAVYAESVHNLGTPVFPRSLFDAVLDSFAADADILTVRHQGKPVASVLSVYHDDGKGLAVMPFWGGGTFAARGLRANERMYYELMLHARKRGCTRFDFGRSKTGSGPYHFKKNWGFEPEPLTYSSWSAPGVAARNIDPTDASYARKIELWKRLPLSLANAIGPHIARGLG